MKTSVLPVVGVLTSFRMQLYYLQAKTVLNLAYREVNDNSAQDELIKILSRTYHLGRE